MWRVYTLRIWRGVCGKHLIELKLHLALTIDCPLSLLVLLLSHFMNSAGVVLMLFKWLVLPLLTYWEIDRFRCTQAYYLYRKVQSRILLIFVSWSLLRWHATFSCETDRLVVIGGNNYRLVSELSYVQSISSDWVGLCICECDYWNYINDIMQ